MPTPTWATFATRWACIEPLRGAERFTAQQVKAEMDLVIRLRYLPGVTAKMRVLYGTRVLRILEVLDAFEEHRETILYCAEWVD